MMLKRAFDITVSAALLALLSPLFPLIALAIRLDSRGPVFFTQRRAGLGGARSACTSSGRWPWTPRQAE